eukprot:Hpha_TRINITY_DN9192_c0_g1::TRINITY_DN9192_c0_g1_i2::g.94551::m.94551
MSDLHQAGAAALIIGAALLLVAIVCFAAFCGSKAAYWEDQARRYEHRQREDAAALRRRPPEILGKNLPDPDDRDRAGDFSMVDLHHTAATFNSAYEPGIQSPRRFLTTMPSLRIEVPTSKSALSDHGSDHGTERSGISRGERSPNARRRGPDRSPVGDLLPVKSPLFGKFASETDGRFEVRVDHGMPLVTTSPLVHEHEISREGSGGSTGGHSPPQPFLPDSAGGEPFHPPVAAPVLASGTRSYRVARRTGRHRMSSDSQSSHFTSSRGSSPNLSAQPGNYSKTPRRQGQLATPTAESTQ